MNSTATALYVASKDFPEASGATSPEAPGAHAVATTSSAISSRRKTQFDVSIRTQIRLAKMRGVSHA